VTSAPPSAPAPAPSVEAVTDDYVDALGCGDEARAVALATGLVDSGCPAQEVLLRLVSPAQVRVLPTRLPAARHTVVAAQRTGTPVLAGGPGFGADGRFARRLGVDAWAPTAADGVALLDRLPWPEPTAPGPGDAGAEAEYLGVRERRGRLVTAAMEWLRARPESSARLADSALDDDLGQLVEFLAAAIYFVDRGLFAGHVGWLAEVAAARGVSGSALPDVLDAFRAELYDFPLAAACLDAGHEVLRRPGMNGADHSRLERPR
jgi:hypothetical protein